MYLKKISGTNIKGRTFAVDLSQANVLIGDNFEGKTTVTDAVRLLLLGYLPELGGTNAATFGLASGSPMTVTGEFSDGRRLTRSWFAKGDSIKVETVGTGFDEKTEVPLLTVMLNSEEYFALSPAKRVEYVFANCTLPAEFTQGGIEARIEAKVPGFTFESLPLRPPIPSIQMWIEYIIGDVANRWKEVKDEEKGMQETIQRLTQLRAGDEIKRPVAAAEDAKLAVKLAISELTDRKALLNGKYTNMVAARDRRVAIARELEKAEADRILKEKLDAELMTTVRTLDAIPTPLIPLLQRGLDASAATYRMQKACENIEAIARQQREKETELAEVDAKTSCPYCGAAGDGWKALRRTECESIIAGCISAMTLAKTEHKTAAAAAEKADKELAVDSENEKRISKLRIDERNIRYNLTVVTQRLERVKALEEERDRLMPLDPDLTIQVESLAGQIKVKEGELRALDAEINASAGRANDQKRIAEAEQKRDKAKADKELLAAAGKELRVIQGELVEAAFKPMLETANAIFGGVLPSPLSYRNGEIGTWRDSWIGHRTMSGTEKLLTYAAIQAALAAKSPVRIMLLDEMGRLTRVNSSKVACAVLEAVKSGRVDQAILVDPERPDIYYFDHIGEMAFTVIPIK